MLILLIALVAGALGGVVLAMAKNYFDDSLQTNEDIQLRLGLPVLSSLSYNATEHTAGERLMVMYHNLNLMFPSEKGRIVQFISANRGEGTTTLVKELARVAAEKFHKKVLWITMEPGPETGSSRSGKQALSDPPRGIFLRQDIRPLGDNGVHVSPSGAILSMIDSRVFAQTLAALREEYDLILIDSPAASMSAYGMTLSYNFDGVVLVVEAERLAGSPPRISGTRSSTRGKSARRDLEQAAVSHPAVDLRAVAVENPSPPTAFSGEPRKPVRKRSGPEGRIHATIPVEADPNVEAGQSTAWWRRARIRLPAVPPPGGDGLIQPGICSETIF